jgi:hypothetical protein
MNAPVPTEPPAAAAPSLLARVRHFAWPVLGLAAAMLCLFLLWRELRHVSLTDVWVAMRQIPPLHLLGALGGAIVAYGSLAAYDRIALLYLGRKLPWPFIAVTSFVAYALSHNLGVAILSGAVVRYRAYTSRGLNGAEVAVLVLFCAFTFGLGLWILGGFVLATEPALALRFMPLSPRWAEVIGIAMLGGVALFAVGSFYGFPPVKVRGLTLTYPRPPIMLRQMIVGPIELIGAASILYFSLPTVGNPGFFLILGVFVVSFGAAIFTHAPGGLGVLELLVVTALPGIPKADVLAALIIFRLFYLVIPLAISLVTVLVFERAQLSKPDG